MLFSVGEKVYAKYNEDSLFYAAEVVSLDEDKDWYTVVFTDYGNTQDQTPETSLSKRAECPSCGEDVRHIDVYCTQVAELLLLMMAMMSFPTSRFLCFPSPAFPLLRRMSCSPFPRSKMLLAICRGSLMTLRPCRVASRAKRSLNASIPTRSRNYVPRVSTMSPPCAAVDATKKSNRIILTTTRNCATLAFRMLLQHGALAAHKK